MRRIILAGIFAAAAISASASSPDAWQALFDATANACLQRSGLSDPKIVEGPVIFSASILYRVSGIWPQPHMKGQIGSIYCLHPYPKGEPEIVDAR